MTLTIAWGQGDGEPPSIMKLERQMEQKKGHSSIAAALAAAQLDMGPALKDSVNPAFKSKYADLASVMAACLPALNKHGIAVVQPIGRDETGARYVETVLIHGETGQQLNCRVDLIIGKNDMQGYGSAVTYARRYGLMGMAGIAPEDDDGNAAAKNPPKASMDDVLAEEPQTSGQAVMRAWTDSVLDKLPRDATDRQRAQAFADAICAEFQGKGIKALEAAWDRRRKMIEAFQDKHPDLFGQIVDAFEIRRNEITEQAA